MQSETEYVNRGSLKKLAADHTKDQEKKQIEDLKKQRKPFEEAVQSFAKKKDFEEAVALLKELEDELA